MVINYQALSTTLRNKHHAVFILIGQEHYLLNDAALQIKNYYQQQGEWDSKILHINQSTDWQVVLAEANSYSLFAEQVLLDVRFDKKTIDAAGKKILKEYIVAINQRCLIILRAPQVSARDMQTLSTQNQVLLIQISPLPQEALLKWIHSQFQANAIRFDKEVPTLIHQHTQGNMLACAQAIERIQLVHNRDEILNVETVLEQLSDQCEFQLYELADACLAGKAEKAIHLLRQANQQRAEPTLILWLLTQEIRQLNLLLHLVNSGLGLSAACTQLKIWSSKVKLYQMALTRFSLSSLQKGLQRCGSIDEQIKTNAGNQIWQSLEQLSLFICTSIEFDI